MANTILVEMLACGQCFGQRPDTIQNQNKLGMPRGKHRYKQFRNAHPWRAISDVCLGHLGKKHTLLDHNHVRIYTYSRTNIMGAVFTHDLLCPFLHVYALKKSGAKT